MLINNYAEKAPVCENPDKICYIPHHGVYHPQKPEKICVAFDCSARYHGFALNDSLLQGSDVTNSLLGALCRFRKNEVAVMGDIKAKFHQVEILTKDRNFLRFFMVGK